MNKYLIVGLILTIIYLVVGLVAARLIYCKKLGLKTFLKDILILPIAIVICIINEKISPDN